ncbi:choline/ethanolamine kinase [Immersiella caudata]|uniref:Choline/ethanolamine kinase n=1 Tax=Immersiella caudata TaxID=314043 RepID=A0AA39WP20_9PEZI|nr:choline/ethanolamine kinase [Immersiella caudata]
MNMLTKMIELTNIRISLPNDKIPSKAKIRDIVAAFFPKEWPSVEPDTLITSYTPKFANPHCTVQRPAPSDDPPIEPLKAFIKFHNPSMADLEAFQHLLPSKQEEAVFCTEFGRTGWGAQAYGLFQTEDGTFGRVDEFLDARTLEPEDVENTEIRADVARGLAAFHAMDLAVEKKEMATFYEALVGGLRKLRGMETLKDLGRKGGVNIDKLVDYDFASQLETILDKLEGMGAKKGWCIHDVQFMNVLVRNDPELGESKTVLIDFEFAMWNYRAFDVGGHFMQKMFKWYDGESKIANCRRYAEEERRHFCEEYVEEWNRRSGNSDTSEKVLLESELGYLLAVGFDIHNMLCVMEGEDDSDPLSLVGLDKLFEEFVCQYGEILAGAQ